MEAKVYFLWRAGNSNCKCVVLLTAILPVFLWNATGYVEQMQENYEIFPVGRVRGEQQGGLDQVGNNMQTKGARRVKLKVLGYFQ